MSKKILFIRYKRPEGILEGGERLAQTHLEALFELFGEENVDVYHIHHTDKKRSFSEYISGAVLFLFNYHFGLTPGKVKDILSRLAPYDYLFIDRSIFGLIAKKARESGYQGKIIGFFHNIERDYFDAKLPHIPGRGIILRCADKNDAMTCKYCDTVIALNERDGRLLNVRYNRKADAFLPIILKDKYQDRCHPVGMTAQKPKCLFIGAYFGPNIEGLEWFIDNVFPHVNISLDIIGKGMDRLSGEKYNASGITIMPNVPSLLPYFEKADIVILPIFSGAGMKVKTCESLMYGKNIIGSTEAFEGYEGDFKQIGSRCDTAEEFIDTINDFAANPRQIFNTYSRNLYLEKYSFDIMVETLRKIMSSKSDKESAIE